MTHISDPAQPVLSFSEDGTPVFNTCHLEEAVKATSNLDMPESCLYGRAADIARAIEAPIGACYLTVLTLMAGMGVRTTDRELVPRLYSALLGPPGTAKSRIVSRAQLLIPGIEHHVVTIDPASHQGIAQEFKPGKDEPQVGDPNYVVPDAVYVLDELNNTLAACNTPGSGLRLAGTLCSLFYLSKAGSSDKRGKHAVSARINILGNLPTRDAVDFRRQFGSASLGGLYDRFLFAPIQAGFTWKDDWNPPSFEWHDERTISLGDLDAELPPADSKPRPMRFAVSIPRAVRRLAEEWRDNAPAMHPGSRNRPMEICLRVAVISAAINGDAEVTPECMTAAVNLIGWQERVRKVYSPSEGTDKADECAAELEQRFKEAQLNKPPDYFFRWRDMDREHGWYRRYQSVIKHVKQYLIDSEMLQLKIVGYSDSGEPIYDKHLMRWAD